MEEQSYALGFWLLKEQLLLYLKESSFWDDNYELHSEELLSFLFKGMRSMRK